MITISKIVVWVNNTKEFVWFDRPGESSPREGLLLVTLTDRYSVC